MSIPWARIGLVAGLAFCIAIGVLFALVGFLTAAVGVFWLISWIISSRYGPLIILAVMFIIWAIVAAYEIVDNAESEGKSIFKYIKDRG